MPQVRAQDRTTSAVLASKRCIEISEPLVGRQVFPEGRIGREDLVQRFGFLPELEELPALVRIEEALVELPLEPLVRASFPRVEEVRGRIGHQLPESREEQIEILDDPGDFIRVEAEGTVEFFE